MFTPIKIAFFLVLAATSMFAQGVAQVSSVTAEPAKLDCSQNRTSKIVAQVAFYGIDTQKKPITITVGLSTYAATPAGNNVDIPVARKDVELRESPGLAEFKAVCSAATSPGEVKLAATILSAPDGVKVEPPANELGVAKLTIAKE